MANKLFLNDAEEWVPMPEPRPGMVWGIASRLAWLDGYAASSSLPADDVIDALRTKMLSNGYKPHQLRFESYTDQIHGFVRYRDGRWRRITNIVYE